MIHFLTKSRFTHALDCPTKLYYFMHNEYASAVDDNDFLRALAEGGLQVGELAKRYYPDHGDDPSALGRVAGLELIIFRHLNRQINRQKMNFFINNKIYIILLYN